MKFAPAAIGIVAAGVAGYFLEPSVRSSLVGALKGGDAPAVAGADDEGGSGGHDSFSPPDNASPQPPVVPAPTPPAPPLEKAPDWVATLTPEQLPEKVTLRAGAIFAIPQSSAPATLPAGAPVTPVRVEGDQLVVSPFGGPIEGKVPVMSTNLVELLGNKAPAVAVVTPAPVTPAPAPVTPAPMPEPTPPEPAPAASLGAEEIVKLMQASIKGGEIKEFGFQDVLGWKAGDEEDRDGESYQTGLVSYKAETIFGVKNIQAQALIKDGAVVKWIWPKSGMEIK